LKGAFLRLQRNFYCKVIYRLTTDQTVIEFDSCKLLFPVTLKSLGCWRDTVDRAIPTLEGLDPVLNGNYKTRQEAIAKCVQAAYSRGYNVIALQDGGWCAGSRDALNTYQKYGPVASCPAKGRVAANHVYKLKIHYET